MFVPVVRRSVTVTTRGVVDMPFSCDACGLSTTAHVQAEGKGTASALYISPDADRARNAASSALHGRAREILATCPCPRCGAAPRLAREALAAWEGRVRSRGQIRKVMLVVGLAFGLLTSGGCGALMIATPNKGMTSEDVILPALVLAAMWFGACAVVTLIVWAILGPGSKPLLLSRLPQNVWMDPPPGG